MLTKEQNDLLTQVGPGTPGGELLRRYWQPVALAEELPPGGDPVPVRILGEDLVLFRDEQGRLGLLGLHCSHRRTDLSYGRIENGGLRCLYHGWLYDVSGRCLEQPGEPKGSTFHEQIRHPAYPCHEVGEIIFTYMGPGEPPLFPAYDLFLAPDEYRFRPNKSLNECSYLQGNEGNIDPLHTSALHLLADNSYRTALSRGNAPLPTSTNTNDTWWELSDMRGEIDVEPTDYGLRIYTVRPVSLQASSYKVTNFVMPNLCVIGGGRTEGGYQLDWHVPIDDTHHWKYTMGFTRSEPADRSVKLWEGCVSSDYRRSRTAANRYRQNREELYTASFTGMGRYFLEHDGFAIESQGLIEDRTLEHLSYSDRAIVIARMTLLKAIQDVKEGREPLHVIRDLAANDFSHLFAASGTLPRDTEWRTHLSEAHQAAVSRR